MSFAQQVKNYMRAGYDQNQATALAMGLPADGPPKPPTPPPAPQLIKPPVQPKSTQASVGQGVRSPRKAKKKTRLSDLRIRRPQVNTALSVGAGGTGLNIGGY
jgi:hypothetical protein